MAESVHCRGCGGPRLKEFLNLGNMPLAGGFLRSRDEIPAEQTFPLPIHVCEDCSLVQITQPIDPNILFRDYAFASSTVGPLVTHFKNYAAWLNDRIHPRTVVEFGCNDGILLEPLKALGVQAVGIDISENITEMARQKGLSVVTGSFRKPQRRSLRNMARPIS
jgi:methylation protein EvaC